MTVEINLITNAITNYIQKRYQLDAIGLQLISTTIINGLDYFTAKIRKVRIDDYLDNQLEQFDPSIFTLFLRRLYYISIILLAGYIVHRYQLLRILLHWSKSQRTQTTLQVDTKKLRVPQSKSEKEYYEIDVSNIHTTLVNVNKFMNLHPEFFETHINHKMVKFAEEEYYPIYSSRVYFNDKIHNVDGYVTTSYSETRVGDNGFVKDYRMILHVNKFVDDKKCYVRQINDYINYQTKHGNRVKLTYYKVLAKSIISHAFYEEDLAKWYDDVKVLKDTFYSPHKDYLFSIMEQKLNGNSAFSNTWNNLILHGKPGVGKSTFIYRIATMLKLSIISVDLSLYIDKKKELYALFHGQEFALPCADGNQNTSKNCIIILEEFDNCIDKLLELENIHHYKKLLIKNQISRRQSALRKQIHDVSEKIEKVQKKLRPMTSLAIDNNNADNAEDDFPKMFNSKEEELLGRQRPPVNKEEVDVQSRFRNFAKQSLEVSDDDDVFDTGSRNTDKNITKATVDLDKILRTTNEENMSDILRLSDLLELFQGPVPIKDRIIIATTNHLDHIRESLPALCRPGRLTPLEFSYLDWPSLNALCQYYFQQDMDCDPVEITIPTSQVVELAVKHVTTHQGFHNFKEELFSLL
jgi:hypothetical protein